MRRKFNVNRDVNSPVVSASGEVVLGHIYIGIRYRLTVLDLLTNTSISSVRFSRRLLMEVKYGRKVGKSFVIGDYNNFRVVGRFSINRSGSLGWTLLKATSQPSRAALKQHSPTFLLPEFLPTWRNSNVSNEICADNWKNKLNKSNIASTRLSLAVVLVLLLRQERGWWNS